MKVMTRLMTMIFFAIMAVGVQAQGGETSNEDFFVGNWNLDVYGLPQGDAKMLLVIEKKDGELGGYLAGENGEEPNKLTSVEIEDKTLYLRFMGGGWDIPMYLDKEGENSVYGSMNDMFDVEGKKVKIEE